MVCCSECFSDRELKAAITSLGKTGDCPLCGAKDVSLYDSDIHYEYTDLEDHLTSVIRIYKAENDSYIDIPVDAWASLEKHLKNDWNIFACSEENIRIIVQDIIEKSLFLNPEILTKNVAVPEVYDADYLRNNSIVKSGKWECFRKELRNNNRFHNDDLNLAVLEDALKDTAITIPEGSAYYRARIMKDEKMYTAKEMGAPPADIASAGRANSKGISCLYLASKLETTVKEIRAGAFDYVTIGTFKIKKNIQVIDLSSIIHNSPFYGRTDKINFMINEKHLREIDRDLAKPVSSRDSELDYLPTQYISDFVKSLGYDGVQYMSTFDKETSNLALFDPSVCELIDRQSYVIDNLDYKLNVL